MDGKAVRGKAMRKAGLGALEYILIAIVVIVLVGVAWLFLSGYIGTAAVNPKAAIQQFDITVTPGGERAAVTLVIKNTGNVRINSVTANWVGIDDGPDLAPPEGGTTTADPGRTLVLTATVDSDTFVIGRQYTVRVTITYANGATEVLTATATARP